MSSTSDTSNVSPINMIHVHGAEVLPAVRVDAYSTELRDGDELVGDRACKSAFCTILDGLRERLDKVDGDPLGDVSTDDLSRKTLEKLLASDDLDAAGLVHSAIEEFAQELAAVIGRFMRLKRWKETERIVIGGGFRASRIGELAIGRAGVLVKTSGLKVDLVPIHHDVDEAGLIGAVHLVPNWMFGGHEAILAADIGGTNMRCGLVTFSTAKKKTLTDAAVKFSVKWRHADDKPTREEAVERLVSMLRDLASQAGKEKIKLAPFIGIGCPGIINDDGSLKSGGQNLPGNWESSRFNLVTEICAGLPVIEGDKPMVLVHNDAVIQGLSEVPFMQDVAHWGAMTIGTGLGNVRFTNLSDTPSKANAK
jgi:hypothetical protein